MSEEITIFCLPKGGTHMGHKGKTHYWQFLIIPQQLAFWIPRLLMILFIGFITWYTYGAFFVDQPGLITLEEAAFYFLPSIIMLALLRIGWKHDHFAGIALLLLSFVFLGIYHIYVSIAAFFFLLFTGILFLTDTNRVTHRHIQKKRYD